LPKEPAVAGPERTGAAVDPAPAEPPAPAPEATGEWDALAGLLYGDGAAPT
jgi:hypothetical protein